ncbi:hypothetical protein GCM10009117_14940 [Gangjinia marincola]|uniref:Secretion system C-terminal sorting domain-containing protein n=1 Tax=Gangjinia marincola TaxID=578463 RepID=A0ABN1MH93_9FLAO
MRKITFLLGTLLLSLPVLTSAQVEVNYTPGVAPTSLAFVEAFNISDGTSATAFGYNADFTQSFSGTSVTIIPNTEIWASNGGSTPDFNDFWFASQGIPSKTLDVLTFNETLWDGTGDAPEFLNEELTFSVDLTEYTFVDDYTLKISVTIFEQDFANFRRETVTIPNTPGSYSVTMPAANVSDADRVWQWGFILEGPMANPDDAASLGTAIFDQAVLSVGSFEETSFSAFPNPVQDKLTITSSATIKNVEVYDITGKMVVSTNESLVNTGVLNAGVYFARVSTDNAVETIRFIKK